MVDRPLVFRPLAQGEQGQSSRRCDRHRVPRGALDPVRACVLHRRGRDPSDGCVGSNFACDMDARHRMEMVLGIGAFARHLPVRRGARRQPPGAQRACAPAAQRRAPVGASCSEWGARPAHHRGGGGPCHRFAYVLAACVHARLGRAVQRRCRELPYLARPVVRRVAGGVRPAFRGGRLGARHRHPRHSSLLATCAVRLGGEGEGG